MSGGGGVKRTSPDPRPDVVPLELEDHPDPEAVADVRRHDRAGNRIRLCSRPRERQLRGTGLNVARSLGRLRYLTHHFADGLLFSSERDVSLGHYADKPILLVHDRQAPHLMSCHQLESV